MTRTMFDAYTPGNLPTTNPPNLYAAYVNGYLTKNNYQQVQARFPSAQILSITVDGTLSPADIADVEEFDYTVDTGLAWARWRLNSGIRPTLYSDRTRYGQLFATLGGTVDYWVATLDGTHFVGPNVVACQYTNNGGKYDSSVVYDDSWHPLTPIPVPQPQEEEDMPIYVYATAASDDGTIQLDHQFLIEDGQHFEIYVPEPYRAKYGDPLPMHGNQIAKTL